MKIYKTIILLLLSKSLIAQPLQKQWDYVIGGDSYEYLTSFIKLSDGNLLMTGYSFSGISGNKTASNIGLFDYWIVKMDTNGLVLWDRTIGGTGDDNLIKAIQTSDGGFLLAGNSNSEPGFNKTDSARGFSYDYWIVKTDSAGTVQWDKTFGSDLDDNIEDLIESNGSYILIGSSPGDISYDKTEAARGDVDYWIIKTDLQGNKIWDKTLGGISYDRCISIIDAGNGNCIIGGYSLSGIGADKTQTSRGGADYWSLKINSNGIKVWDKTLGSNRDEFLFKLVKKNNKIYWFGVSNSDVLFDKTVPNHGSTVNVDYWILQTDTNGVKISDKVFGGDLDDNDINSVQITNDNGWLLGGTSYSYPSGDKSEANLGPENMWCLKTDSLLNKQWDKTILTDAHEEQNLGIEYSNGTYFFATTTIAPVAGDKSQPNWGQNDFWVSRWAPVVGINNAIENNFFSIYYNDVENKLVIRNKEKGAFNIFIYGITGKLIYSNDLKKSYEQIRLDGINRGVYFVALKNNRLVFTSKVVVK